MKLTDGTKELDERVERGNKCLRLVWGDRTPEGEDRESAAKDAISDILTALFGPAGHHVETDSGWEPVMNDFAMNEARRILDAAERSYLGDAEDYSIERSA